MISIDLDDKVFSAVLDKIRAKTDDMRPVLELCAIQAMRMMASKFRNEGPGWAPLKPATLKRRARLNKSGPILVVNATLRNSIVSPSSSRGGIYKLDAGSVEIGSNLVYAATHQFGRGPIPARPYLPTAEETVEPFTAKMLRYLEDISRV